MSAVTGPNVTTEGPSLAGNNTSWSSPVASAPPSSHQLLNRLPYAPDLPQSIVSPFSSTPTYQAVNCEDITAERSHLPPNDQLWNAIRRFLNYYNSAFAVFHEPTVYAQVRSFLFDSAVARYDVCLVYSECVRQIQLTKVMLAIAACVDGRMAYIGARSPHNRTCRVMLIAHVERSGNMPSSTYPSPYPATGSRKSKPSISSFITTCITPTSEVSANVVV